MLSGIEALTFQILQFDWRVRQRQRFGSYLQQISLVGAPPSYTLCRATSMHISRDDPA
jgi:hypothetical protein